MIVVVVIVIESISHWLRTFPAQSTTIFQTNLTLFVCCLRVLLLFVAFVSEQFVNFFIGFYCQSVSHLLLCRGKCKRIVLSLDSSYWSICLIVFIVDKGTSLGREGQHMSCYISESVVWLAFFGGLVLGTNNSMDLLLDVEVCLMTFSFFWFPLIPAFMLALQLSPWFIGQHFRSVRH